ncbi:OmpA family protein [Endozoicomonas lisbonensis]|uniref:Outer membrane protein OmpA-like peptidoglycan-associated protein n=1 Tax=Endozoicomonas lisbonensis TaxID=3120522 RepID=A0ABV2SPY3_9GAMM
MNFTNNNDWQEEPDDGTGTEWLSVADLMSGLLLLFALLIVAALYQLKTIQETSEHKRIVIIQALERQLNDNGINAEVNPETGDITLLDSVLFDFDKYYLKPEGKVFLDKFIPVYANVIFSNPVVTEEIVRVIIEGHTSSDGIRSYNMNLSSRRSNSVYQYIDQMKINNKPEFLKKISISGRGSMDANLEKGLAEDRKVVFKMQFRSEEAFMNFLKGS